MAATSKTPLLMDDHRDDLPAAVEHDMVTLQLLRTEGPPAQPSVDSVELFPSSSQRTDTGRPREGVQASVRRGDETTGVTSVPSGGGSIISLIDTSDCVEEQAIRCMCCDDDQGDTDSQTLHHQDGNDTTGSAGATTRKPSGPPRTPKASQSLPTLLGAPVNASKRLHQTSAQSAEGSLPSDRHNHHHHYHLPRQPAKHCSSSPVQPGSIRGIVSDSMLSIPSGDICRICHTGRRHEPLIGPCLCAGSMRFTHQRCLTTWLAQSGRTHCELCGYKFKTKMIGPRNIFQWKALPLTVVDKLHLVVFALSLFLFAGTTAYITWTASTTSLDSYTGPASLATQILLPVYCSLSLVSLGLVMYEMKNTCFRLARRWRALNMGLGILEREIDDEDGDGGEGRSAEGVGGDAPLSSVRGTAATGNGRSDAAGLGSGNLASDWSVWSETRADNWTGQTVTLSQQCLPSV